MITQAQLKTQLARRVSRDSEITTGIPNLIVRLRPGNRAAIWQLRYTSPATGKRVKRSLGNAAEISPARAKRRAAECMDEIDAGRDPAIAPVTAGTWGELAERYVADKTSPALESKPWSERHAADVRRILIVQFARFADLDCQTITPAMISKPVVDHIRRAPTAGRRTFKIVSAFLNWLRDTAHVEHSAKLPKIDMTARVKTRVLDDAELEALRDALDELAPGDRCLCEILLYTSQRLGQIAKAEAAQFAEPGIWRVPKEIVKIRRDLVVPIDGIRIPDRPFPTGADKFRGGRARVRPQDAIDRWKAHAGVEFTANDLRRTMRRVMTTELGVAPHVQKLCLGQTLGQALKDELAEHYTRAADFEIECSRAFAGYRRHIDGLGKAAAKVVPLR